MSVTIAGVPEKISRADFFRVIESLGIDYSDLISLVFHPNSIEAVLIARGANGAAYLAMDPDNDQTRVMARHHIHIPVED
jgi:hypothetical protein